MSEAEEAANRSLSLAEARYRAGADSLLSFIDSQRTALDTADQAVSAQLAARRARVDVHRALAQ